MHYDELLEQALEKMEASGMDESWLNLGCETKSQNRLNREYMDRITFVTRLIEAAEADISTELFGVQLETPIISSVWARGRVLETLKHGSVAWYKSPPYLEHIASALGSVGSMMGVGAVELHELAGFVNHGCPMYHVVKPKPDEDLIFEHLKAAEKAGYVAVGMDITPSFGHKALNEDPSIDVNQRPKTKKQLASYVEATSLPFIVKGVLSVEDAVASKDVGASAIVVSNHGGECIDYSAPILKMLPEIREAVPDLKIIVDSGFRRGTDALKALCLGADAVAIVTPQVIGYAANGRHGVQAMMESLSAELQRTMSAVGIKDIASANADVLRML